MMYLIIETTTDKFSIALGNRKGIISYKEVPGYRHSEKIIPILEKILMENSVLLSELDAIGVGIGPGSFTGIRVGASCAVTLAQLEKIPLYGISALDIAGKKISNPAIKAFREKYYTASYSGTGKRESSYNIIDNKQLNEIDAEIIEVKASNYLDEVDILFKSNEDGDWRKLNPIYIMETEYIKQKDRRKK